MFQLDILFLFIIIHFLMNHGCAPWSFWIFPLHFSLLTKAHVICNMPITIWFICIGGPNLHWRYNKEVPSSLLFPKYHVECDWSSDNKTSYNDYFLVIVVDNSSKVHNQSRPVARRLSTCMADKHTVHRMALLVDCSGYLPIVTKRICEPKAQFFRLCRLHDFMTINVMVRYERGKSQPNFILSTLHLECMKSNSLSQYFDIPSQHFNTAPTRLAAVLLILSKFYRNFIAKLPKTT